VSLWIGGVLEGDRTATPTLTGLHLEYDEDGWMRHLPAFYARDEDAGALLRPALALLVSLMDDIDEEIGGLPARFDARSAPDGPAPSWLDWLAGWLAFPLGEAWPEPARRWAVADAFALQGRRGTAGALRRFAALYAGATILVDEPTRSLGVWALGEPAGLGFDTTLASGPAQGAVLGTTAELGGSDLVPGGAESVPLFGDLAHRFRVWAYAAELPTAEAVARLRRLIDREKPAHTVYDLCLIGPAMRVGHQATLGVDSIVGGPGPGLVLGEPAPLGQATILGAEPGARLGETARVGLGATLS
jgi:phage tail-like protein